LGFLCFLIVSFLLRASSFSATFVDRFSASAKIGFQSLLLTVLLMRSVSSGSFAMVSLILFSAASSVSTSSRASSGQNSTHCGCCPLQRSHAVAKPVSGWMVIPPCSQACTHQSQPLHFFSLTMRTPVFSDCVMAFSGQAVTHLASSQNRHAKAKLNSGFIRTKRIRDRRGFQLASPFSWLHAYSQIPQPVHLEGSTETNFLWVNFAGGISVTKAF